MNDKKNILLHLYGDPDAEGDLRSLLKDPELRNEHRVLSEAKFRMDHIRRVKPDAGVVDSIVADAVDAARTAPGKRRADRPALRRYAPLRKVLVPALSIAAVTAVAIGFGWLSFIGDNVAPERQDRAALEMPAAPESLLRATPINPDLVTPAAVAKDPLLAWDEAETIRNLYRRIESIRPSSPLDWGERSVPLESLPGSALNPSSRLQQVGAQNR